MKRHYQPDALEAMMQSIRPEKPILAFRWVELQQQMSWMEVIRLLRKGRYQRWGRWFAGLAVVIFSITWVVAKEQIAIVGVLAMAATAGMFVYRWLFSDIDLNSLVIFYDDKATIIQEVKLLRVNMEPTYKTRRDVTSGAISKKFVIANLNPFWRIANLSISLRGTWLVLSMQSGWISRPRKYQLSMAQDKAVTFSEMKRRLLSYLDAPTQN